MWDTARCISPIAKASMERKLPEKALQLSITNYQEVWSNVKFHQQYKYVNLITWDGFFVFDLKSVSSNSFFENLSKLWNQFIRKQLWRTHSSLFNDRRRHRWCAKYIPPHIHYPHSSTSIIYHPEWNYKILIYFYATKSRIISIVWN